ncbi:ASKHA domain-containing protein [Thermodesulfovibrio hydrogeniphilus]
MFRISTNFGKTFEAEGRSLLEVLQKNNVYLPASCGGKGSCGRCKIRVVEGKVRCESFFGISESERKSGYVLACQAYPESDIFVEIPERLIAVSDKISKAKVELIERVFKKNPNLFKPLITKITISLDPPNVEDSRADFERLKDFLGEQITVNSKIAQKVPEILRKRNWKVDIALAEGEILSFLEPNEKVYGIAVDIGTTTVVLSLIDVLSGKIVEIASCYNSQISYGDDVITRIIYAVENSNGLDILRKAIIDDINALISAVSAKHKDGRIFYCTVAGNTTMCHIFWGINPQFIREEPYTPVFSQYPRWKAINANLNLEENTPVYTFPSVAGYVGGDIVAGLLATGMHEAEEISLFIDIGTNGEIVIGNKDWLATASTSAGPCFEGSGISCGMRATEGAIEEFKYDKSSDEFQIKVIGGGKPKGICGSGMIDIICELFQAGVIDSKGRFVSGSSSFLRYIDDEIRFYISEDCYISQADIDNIVRAKAAIYAGITTLLNEIGISEKDISKVYVAGGFGEFLNVEKAIKIGMLPNLPVERFAFVGNTSLAGSILCLLSKPLRDKAEEIANKMTYIDLSRSKTFMDEYVSALFIPHTDLGRFAN